MNAFTPQIDWKQRMVDILAAGRPPTNDELEEALAGALAEGKARREELERITEERDQARGIVSDMSIWLGKMADAFLKRDADKLAETVGEFIAKRVKLVPAPTGEVH